VLTDADGNVQGTASFDAFGNELAQSGASSPFGYDGMYRDAESGLYAMSGGVYDPATGQGLKGLFNPKEYSISKSVQWEPHKSPGLRCGDGYDEDCNGSGDELSVLSPYAAGGGDPVNGTQWPRSGWIGARSG
jgi:hypothetical protein